MPIPICGSGTWSIPWLETIPRATTTATPMQIYPSKSPFQNRPTFSSRQADCPTQTDTITDTTTEFHFFQHKPAPSRTPTQSSFDTAPNSEYPLNSDNKRRPLVPDKQKDYTFELFLFQGANGSKCCQQYRLLVTSYSDDQFHPNSDNRRCRQLIPTTTDPHWSTTSKTSTTY